MNPVGLSLEQAPPFDAPLRFFLTAPLFLVLAAMVLLWHGPDFFISRWLPAPLAFTHLLTLGFMTPIMIGALLQILPVVIGVTVPRPQWIAALIHLPLTLGTLTLAGAFLLGIPLGFQIASGLLGLGFGVALIAFNLAAWRAPVTSGVVIAVRCALGGLLITVILGLLLSGFFGWGLSLPVVTITTLHAVWGLIGWTVLLVAGIADQVVPMFHITPAYPRWLSRRFAPLMTVMLAIWSGLMLGNWETAAQLAGVMLAVGIAVFAGMTLHLLNQRRRKIGDPVLAYWRISLISLLASAALWLAASFMPNLLPWSAVEWLLGILLIVGFAGAVINGMLYKIVPFLAWFHLQAHLLGRAKVPHMKQLLPDAPVQRQGRAYLTALLLLLAATVYPPLFTYPAALALGVTGAWLGVNLWRVWHRYDHALRIGLERTSSPC